jgi:hypothetical protein
MATMAREASTDERLDDLKDGMHREFGQVHAEIRELRAESNARFDAMNARFDAMQRTMIAGFAAITAAILASVLGAIVANGIF